MELRKKIEDAINSCSAEEGSNTPDFILAEYLTDCLAAFDKASMAREQWYGERRRPGGALIPVKRKIKVVMSPEFPSELITGIKKLSKRRHSKKGAR